MLARGRRARSATTRCGTGARSADPPPTAIRRPTCPPCCSRSTPTFVVQRAERRADGRARPTSSSGFLETALAPDELLVEIRVPKTGANGFAYQKFNRRAQDWAIVGAVAARVNGGTHVALVNMGTVPIARHVRSSKRSRQGASVADAAAHAAEGTEPTRTSTPRPSTASTSRACSTRRALEAV